jgi:hypothetical protein
MKWILLTNPCHGKGREPMQTKTDLRIGKKQRILITGDSHARGIAAELQYNLNKNFGVQGVVKITSLIYHQF